MSIAWHGDMKLALIGLSKEGTKLVDALVGSFCDAHVFLHREAGAGVRAKIRQPHGTDRGDL